MVERKIEIVSQEEIPFYKYLFEKVLEEHTIGDLDLAVNLGIVTTSFYLKFSTKK